MAVVQMTREEPERASAADQLQLDAFLPFELAVVANRISQMIGNLISQKFDLQVPDWRILVTLNRYGPLPPNEVADRTAMDKARVSRAQRRLGDLKLVSIADDPVDGRRKVLTLEPLGQQVCSEMIPEAIEVERRLLTCLTAAEEVAMRTVLGKLHARTNDVEFQDS